MIHDHGEQLERWKRTGLIWQLDTAFFLDEGDGGFAQDRLLGAGARVIEWIEKRRGILYVCGRATTLGAGVDAALRDILVREGVVPDAAAASKRLAEWEADGSIRRDLFG